MPSVTLQNGTELISGGVYETRNVVADGNKVRYAYHPIPDPQGITLKLDQSRLLGSLQFILYNADDRHFNYYIETSADGENWRRIIDRTAEACKSVQTLEFDPHPVAYIRIVGTYCSEIEYFHIYNFQCPASC
ncbi:hypothetical protein QR680_003827 [Steinernema hermaphroditum]|uniref:F5/8 type C domain-containing protein n=1 Tax=Steinernema hermaphroditum TaxID=289476 RepID=A0AA39HLP7_9BILA|nr:hypothetical protein QR680_003827 [Steinernema hermaphroditum]